ncbi:hypothetical protein DM02DRAFT_654148 [Periconia macrospinosa]|uniref:Uncharacterized protein n=1 Tax=Periconia macrospinosa TaxID=97972 RepID=A0A2V1DUM1_9PLEO|nr:hypothetical protein DM02DRAFT_654148 [Periconia macrospinosa]
MSDPPTARAPTRSPGAEQDRYQSHFGIGQDRAEKVKEAAVEVVIYKGHGAEQDRYATHFSPDSQVVREAALSLLKAKASGAEQDRLGNHFGLGADGWERAKRLAFAKGEGAEQDRFRSHFSLDDDTVSNVAGSIEHGVKESINRVTR